MRLMSILFCVWSLKDISFVRSAWEASWAAIRAKVHWRHALATAVGKRVIAVLGVRKSEY